MWVSSTISKEGTGEREGTAFASVRLKNTYVGGDDGNARPEQQQLVRGVGDSPVGPGS